MVTEDANPRPRSRTREPVPGERTGVWKVNTLPGECVRCLLVGDDAHDGAGDPSHLSRHPSPHLCSQELTYENAAQVDDVMARFARSDRVTVAMAWDGQFRQSRP